MAVSLILREFVSEARYPTRDSSGKGFTYVAKLLLKSQLISKVLSISTIEISLSQICQASSGFLFGFHSAVSLTGSYASTGLIFVR